MGMVIRHAVRNSLSVGRSQGNRALRRWTDCRLCNLAPALHDVARRQRAARPARDAACGGRLVHALPGSASPFHSAAVARRGLADRSRPAAPDTLAMDVDPGDGVMDELAW